MTDSITCTVTIDLADLHSYTQVGEEDWGDEPVSLADAVVAAASRRLITELVKDELLTKIRDKITDELVRVEVEKRIEVALSKPVRKTNQWGEPNGPAVTITDMLDAEIHSQLTAKTDRYGNTTSVLDRVIKECVNARLEADLKAAFGTARQAMLDAAAEVGKKAMAAAVAKAIV